MTWPRSSGLDLSLKECRTWVCCWRPDLGPILNPSPNLLLQDSSLSAFQIPNPFQARRCSILACSKFGTPPEYHTRKICRPIHETWAHLFRLKKLRKSEGEVESFWWGPPFQPTVSLWIYILYTPILQSKANSSRFLIWWSTALCN